MLKHWFLYIILISSSWNTVSWKYICFYEVEKFWHRSMTVKYLPAIHFKSENCWLTLEKEKESFLGYIFLNKRIYLDKLGLEHPTSNTHVETSCTQQCFSQWAESHGHKPSEPRCWAAHLSDWQWTRVGATLGCCSTEL